MQAVGTSQARLDARSKTDGTARYADDLSFPGMLHAAVVGSTRPHAEVLEVDARPALELPLVRGVFSARDIPGQNLIPLIIPDLTLLAGPIARYLGDPVAVVAAETREAAQAAAGAVRITYRDLPAVFDMHDALRPDAPKLHQAGNVYTTLRIRRGDVEEGFARAAAVVEDTYRTPAQEHAYLEPQGMVAVPQPDGGMTVYGSMQCPFYCHQAVARVLGLPMSRLRMVQTATGGGFGGKEDVPSIVAGLAALAAHRLGRPVKLVYDRMLDMRTMSKRHPGFVKYRSAATRDGDLCAIEVEILLDGGAYATLSPAVLWRATVHASGPYRCPNVKVSSSVVATNRVPAGAFRGFGTLQVIFAHEIQMTRLAHAVGMDPLEFRLRNALRVGDETSTGQVLKESVGLVETLEKAAAKARYHEKKRALASRRAAGPKRRGLGIGTIFYGVGLGAKGKYIDRTGAYVQVTGDGTARVAIGNAEMGQGLRTVVSQICAEELGIPYANVFTDDSDTSRVPDSGPTVASRATVMSGNAVVDACRKIRKVFLGLAAELLDAGAEDLRIEDGRVTAPSGASRDVLSVIAEAHARRLDLAAHGYALPQPTSFDDETGQGTPYEVYSYATNICEVEVDTETGQVEVIDFVAAHDVGRAINPQLVEGQIQGGTVQGLGFSLTEEVVYDGGRIVNPRFSTYIIPTMADVPPIHPVIVEHPYSRGPYGAKGIGEPPIMGVAPAVVNAIHDACGVWLTQVPATPERVWQKLQENGEAR